MTGEGGLGKKRPAPDDPDVAQPLTKRFGGLRLDNSLPISARAQSKGHIQHIHNQHNQPDIDHLQTQFNQRPPSPEPMLLDDTKHTTYIHNLDQELIEDDSPGLIFSPFAKKVLSVPQSVLTDSKSGKELVLYTEPVSLTVPKEKDNVRKAILECRARARENKVTEKEDLYDPMDID
ncbi:uncharacterized protein PGRI_067110 [Penicillium griseofulvum]|uniref:Uncharacterized protein n=1 Tax=Penicillium patulum TaxID=5078 RepID=A0A135LQF8_PENPA|nr:uncharacterized protein PGRI_067110 [Penicillium griseofulvum]KXG51139.1 hypothetical protein PGRI_067110 [Penicillium griseofulvum]